MLKKVTVGTLVGVLVLGMLMVPAAASHLDTDAGELRGVARTGSSWTGCAADGASQVSDTYGSHDWSHFEMGNTGPTATASSIDTGTVGSIKLCARLGQLSSFGNGNPMGNPGSGCAFRDGKGSIKYGDGRETLWLRNVRSHGDVMRAVQPLMGEVVAAADAATAATMTAHHYIYIELETAIQSPRCSGQSRGDFIGTYRIVEQNQSELPLLCEDDLETSGCLYGPSPSWLPPL